MEKSRLEMIKQVENAGKHIGEDTGKTELSRVLNKWDDGSDEYWDFIPDFDEFHLSVYTTAGRITKVLQLSSEILKETSVEFGRSFINNHPQYQKIWEWTNYSETPTFCATVERMGTLQLQIVHLVDAEIAEREATA